VHRCLLLYSRNEKMKLPSPTKADPCTGSRGSTGAKREESSSGLAGFSGKVRVVSESSNHWVVPLPRRRVALRMGHLDKSVKSSPSSKNSSSPVFPEALFLSWEMGEVNDNKTDLPSTFNFLKSDPFVTPIAGRHFVPCFGDRGMATLSGTRKESAQVTSFHEEIEDGSLSRLPYLPEVHDLIVGQTGSDHKRNPSLFPIRLRLRRCKPL
jgi:hypothetical protein